MPHDQIATEVFMSGKITLDPPGIQRQPRNSTSTERREPHPFRYAIITIQAWWRPIRIAA
jgi:hypothetical protein